MHKFIIKIGNNITINVGNILNSSMNLDNYYGYGI